MNGKKLMRAELVRMFLLVSLVTTMLLVAVSVRAMGKPGGSDQSTQYRSQTEVDPTTDWGLNDQAAQGAVGDITTNSGGDHDDDDDDDDDGGCLSIDKTVDKEWADVGDPLTYTITVTNNCPACQGGGGLLGGHGDDDDDDDDDDDADCECVGTVVVVDQIPLHTTYVSDSASEGGTVNTDGDRTYIKWEFPSLPQGESRTMEFDVTVDRDTDATKIVNTACVSSDNEGDGCDGGWIGDDDDDDDDEDSGGCGSVGCPGGDDDDDDDDDDGYGGWCCDPCGDDDDDDDDDDEDSGGSGSVGCPGGDDDDDDDDDDCCCACDTVITRLGCGECDGKVTQLTLRYNGAVAANIQVVQKKPNVEVFNGTVQPGEEFTVYGQDDKGTLSTEIKIFVDTVEHTAIHTSCSQPIGPGLVRGDFEVVEGYSRNGGPLCSDCEIGDRVWKDDTDPEGEQNADPIFGIPEEGFNDVRVCLYSNSDNDANFEPGGDDALEHCTYTTSGTSKQPDGWPDGIYGFDFHSLGLGTGQYWVWVDKTTLPPLPFPEQWVSTTGGDHQLVNYTGGDDFSFDFGYKSVTSPQSVGRIGDRVWDDQDGSATQSNIVPTVTEPGLDGVKVYLYWDNGDGVFDRNTDTQVGLPDTTQSGTSEDPDGYPNGIYGFDLSYHGTYWVWVDETTLPGQGVTKNWTSTTNNNPEKVIYTGTDDLSIDFGYQATSIPTAVTLSSFAANSSAGGSVNPLWLGMAGLAMLAVSSLLWAKRRTS